MCGGFGPPGLYCGELVVTVRVMAISEKLKPLTDSILSVLTSTRAYDSSPNALLPAEKLENESLRGYMATKDIMSALGMTGTTSEVAKMRAALKALTAAGAVYRLGLTRATRYKVVLPEDDDADDVSPELAASTLVGADPSGAVLISGGQVALSPETAAGEIPVLVLGDEAVNTSGDESVAQVAA